MLKMPFKKSGTKCSCKQPKRVLVDTVEVLYTFQEYTFQNIFFLCYSHADIPREDTNSTDKFWSSYKRSQGNVT